MKEKKVRFFHSFFSSFSFFCHYFYFRLVKGNTRKKAKVGLTVAWRILKWTEKTLIALHTQVQTHTAIELLHHAFFSSSSFPSSSYLQLTFPLFFSFCFFFFFLQSQMHLSGSRKSFLFSLS